MHDMHDDGLWGWRMAGLSQFFIALFGINILSLRMSTLFDGLFGSRTRITLRKKYEDELDNHLALMKDIADGTVDALADDPDRRIPKRLLERVRYIVKHGKPGVAQLDRVHIKTFQAMEEHLEHELGGYIDFDGRGKVDFVQTFFGDTLSVDIRNYASIEVCWHTHSWYKDGRPFSPPSPADFFSSFEEFEFTGCQLQLVFAQEGIYVFWARLEALRDYYDGLWGPRRQRRESKKLQQLFNDACISKDLENYEEYVDFLGFDLFLVPWGNSVRLAFYLIPEHVTIQSRYGKSLISRRPEMGKSPKRKRRGRLQRRVALGYIFPKEDLHRD